MTKPQKHLRARELRRQGWQVTKIAIEVGVTKETVTRWCDDIALTQKQILELEDQSVNWIARQRGADTNRNNARIKRLEYQKIGRERAKSGSSLHRMRCMLYWAEGAKHRSHLRFVNTDPSMMKIFMRFLVEELQVPQSKMRLQIMLHQFDDENQAVVKNYWLNLLNLPQDTKVTMTKKQGTKSRAARYPNGICSIALSNVKAVQHIFGAIQEYIGFEREEWLD